MNLLGQSKISRAFSLILVLSFASALYGCGAKLDSTSIKTSSGLTISGSLPTGIAVRATRRNADLENLGIVTRDVSIESVTDYGVRCVTLSGTPEAGEGSCDSTGKFSLSLLTSTGVPIGCFVIKGTGSSASIVAVVAFEGTTTGLDGNAQREGSYVSGNDSGGLDFGTVNVDLSTGQATVTKADIKTDSGAAPAPAPTSGTFVDVSGQWTIHALSSVPSGYQQTCPAGTAQGTCDGPIDGQSVWFAQYSVSDGSASHHGLALWDSQSAQTACIPNTTTYGEGAQLPSGWTGASAGLTNHLKISTTFPDPSTVQIQSNGGQAMCGITISGGNTTCDKFGSSYTWSAGSNNTHWGFTPAQCQFYCSMQGMWNNQSGCGSDFNVDWAGFGSALQAATPVFSGGVWSGVTADSSPPGGASASYFSGKVVFGNKPKNRFMFSEIIITGSVGTLVDSDNHLEHACATYDAQGNCTNAGVVCHVNQNNTFTIVQTDSTHATATLIQKKSLDPSDDAVCSTDTNSHISIGEQKMMFSLSKP